MTLDGKFCPCLFCSCFSNNVLTTLIVYVYGTQRARIIVRETRRVSEGNVMVSLNHSSHVTGCFRNLRGAALFQGFVGLRPQGLISSLILFFLFAA